MANTSSTFDFDAFWREFDTPDEEGVEEPSVPPKIIRILGKDYPLPNTLPASHVLLSLRDAHTMTTRIKLLDRLFGEDVVLGWTEAGLTLPALRVLSQTAEGLIHGTSPDTFMEIAKKKQGEQKGEAEEMKSPRASDSTNRTLSKDGATLKARSDKAMASAS